MMMKKKPNVLFLPVRSPTLSPEEWVERINKTIFPVDDWNIFVLIRKPMLMQGYKKNITPIDIYADKIYRLNLTDDQISRAENWLGQSFNSILYMESLRYHTKFRPTRRDRENLAKNVVFFRKILKEKKIDFAAICFPNEAVNITMHYVLKKMKIPFWNLIKFYKGPSFDRKLFDLVIDSFPSQLVELDYDKKNVEKVFNDCRNKLLERKNSLCAFVKKRSSKNFSFSLGTLKMKLRQLKNLLNHQSKYEKTIDIKEMGKVYLKNFLNSKINSKLFGWWLFDKIPKEPFFYFPLHFSKDYQISFRETFVDQIELIKKIAVSLPHGTKLVVKSHPHFLGSDYSYSGFKKIKNNPGVILAHFNEDSLNLIEKSIGLITINSSAGYEAILLGKPVITFGDEFFSKEGVALKINDLKKLPKILLTVKNNPGFGIDIDERKKMVYAYHMNAFPLDVPSNFVDKTLEKHDQEMVKSKYKQLEKFMMKK